MVIQYLLDTNAWILYLKKPGSKIQARPSNYSPNDVATCSIVLSELLHGAEKYGNRNQRVAMVRTFLSPFQCFSFDDVDAAQYAILRHGSKLWDRDGARVDVEGHRGSLLGRVEWQQSSKNRRKN